MSGDRSRTVNLNPVKALNDWDPEDVLSSLTSPPASLNILSNSNPRLVHHDHTYSLPQEHASVDVGEYEIVKFGGEGEDSRDWLFIFPFADGGSCGKERAQMTPLHVEEPAEQVLDLWEDYSYIAGVGARFLIPH